MIIVSDFDGVLFNDHRFKRDYRRLLSGLGVPYRIHQTAYQKAKTGHPSGAYRHDAHLAIIKEHVSGFSIPRAERAINALLAHSSKYLYHDSRPFLQHWKNKKVPLCLASSGFTFQKKKVRKSKLLPFFRMAKIEGTAYKIEPLKNIKTRVPGKKIIFIDDTLRVVDAVKKRFPSMLVIQLVRRKDQARSGYADAVVKNLAAARRICEQFYRSKNTRPTDQLFPLRDFQISSETQQKL